MVKACDPLNLVPPAPLQLGDDPVPDPCVEGGGVPTQALDLAHVHSHGQELLVDLVGDLLALLPGVNILPKNRPENS